MFGFARPFVTHPPRCPQVLCHCKDPPFSKSVRTSHHWVLTPSQAPTNPFHPKFPKSQRRLTLGTRARQKMCLVSTTLPCSNLADTTIRDPGPRFCVCRHVGCSNVDNVPRQVWVGPCLSSNQGIKRACSHHHNNRTEEPSTHAGFPYFHAMMFFPVSNRAFDTHPGCQMRSPR